MVCGVQLGWFEEDRVEEERTSRAVEVGVSREVMKYDVTNV